MNKCGFRYFQIINVAINVTFRYFKISAGYRL